MDNYQVNPLKLYIQDIFRANRTEENKYVYEIFGIKFKNIMIHGVVTSVNNVTNNSINIELSDPTGSVYVYYVKSKNNTKISDYTMQTLYLDFADASKFGDSNIQIMNVMMERINKKKECVIQDGDYLQITGDIFVDVSRGVRMVSAYECHESSVERDIVWMEELQYLYKKYYLPKNK